VLYDTGPARRHGGGGYSVLISKALLKTKGTAASVRITDQSSHWAG
jgi:hypothetical protein